MTPAEELAARLRQAVQGCVVHIHGPVQAWAAIRTATGGGLVTMAEVSMAFDRSCRRRLAELTTQGVPATDARVVKEVETLLFASTLFAGEAAEMLWVVMANVSGGDWSRQPEEWQRAAARARDDYHALSAGGGHVHR